MYRAMIKSCFRSLRSLAPIASFSTIASLITLSPPASAIGATISSPILLPQSLPSPILLAQSLQIASYRSFPATIGRLPKRPGDAMDTSKLNSKFTKPHQLSDTDLTPQIAVTEIKYAVCKITDSSSRRPGFKVHNLRSSLQNADGEIVNIIRDLPDKETDPDLYDYLMRIAKQMLKLDLDLHNISEDQLKQLRWPEKGDEFTFWNTALLKHSRFSLDDVITDYASKTFNLANPVLNGTEEQLSLGEFLEMKGFVTGKYHDVADLLPVLKEFFNVDAYPTFEGHGGYHPSLSEIGVLTTKDCSARMSYPMSTTVPQGKFLIRRF